MNIVRATPWVVMLLVCWYVISSKPANIQIEDDYSCEISQDPDKVADYIMRRYGRDGDLSKIVWALYNHGFYLRNFDDDAYVFISTHEGSPCTLRMLAVDSAKIVARTDASGKVLTLERN